MTIFLLRYFHVDVAMATDQSSICLEMPIVIGPGVGRTLFMDGVNRSTTLADLERWIRWQVPMNKQVVAVDIHMGDHGVLLNVAGGMQSDSKVMDYLCYDKPLPVRIREAEGGFVIVKTLKGENTYIPCVDTMSIDRLQLEIQEKEGTPVKLQGLIFNGKLLMKGTLRDHDIKRGSTVHLFLKVHVGGRTMSRTFVDITKDKLRKIRWNKDAPDWRLARHGLCLEGLCKNEACPAYDKMVVMNFDYGNVDLVGNPKLLNRCKCPECWSKVIPLVPAFNHCFFRIAARKAGGIALFQKPWTSCDNLYYRYDVKECFEASFDRLQFFVKPLGMNESKQDVPEADNCAICFDKLEKSYYSSDKKTYQLPNCSHYLHELCAAQWASRGGNCPCCRAPII